MIVAAVAGSGDDRAPIAANDWPGITDVPDPLSVFDPTLGGAGPTGFRPLLPRDQVTPVYQPRFTDAAGVTWNPEDLVIGVNLEADDDVVREVDGDRTWDAATGIGLGATDQNLDSLPSLTSFPRDYLRFFQNGVFWLPTGLVPVAGCNWDQGTDAWNLRGLVECGE